MKNSIIAQLSKPIQQLCPSIDIVLMIRLSYSSSSLFLVDIELA
jgi:hypothetical protein